MHTRDAATSPFVIAVANRKGGTGKTTTAVNLAAGLTRLGLSTLLVDMDSQGHAGLGFGIGAQPRRDTAHSIFDHGPDALAPTIRTFAGISGWPDVAPADTFSPHPGNDVAPSLLAEALSTPALKMKYDAVVVDTPPSFDSLMVTALSAAHAVIVPFIPHPLAVEGVRQFTRIFFSVRLGGSAGLKHVTLLPVMASPRFVIHQRMIGGLSMEFGQQRFSGLIRNDIRLAEAFAKREPIFDYDPQGRGAEDYRSLSRTLSAEWNLTPGGGASKEFDPGNGRAFCRPHMA